MITNLVRLIIVILATLPFPAYANGSTFNSEEVRANVREYLNVVFGSQKPTLKDYIKYAGNDPGYEAWLMLRACKIKFPDKDPESSDECGRYITSRYNNMDKVESFYFRLLREKLEIAPSSVSFAEIRVLPTRNDDAYRVSVSWPNSKHQIIIGHAKRRDLTELGFVGVIEVDQQPIKSFLKLDLLKNK